jgi:large subunit ribosomal protein L6
MPKDLKKTLDIPEGVTLVLEGNSISVTGPRGSSVRELWYPGIVITLEENQVMVDSSNQRKKQVAMMGTIASHISNMINGVTDGYTYRMKVVYSHFPIQLKVVGDHLSIGNFLGEKKPRKAKIQGDTKVETKGDEVIVSGIAIEDVGQTAANIQQATKIKRFDPSKRFDPRVFQDGIYMVEKTTA